VRIWDTATGQGRAVLTGHQGGVSAMADAPDGTLLAVGGRDGTVRIWDTRTWREHSALTGHQGGLAAVAIAPDGSWLATADADWKRADVRRGATVRIWDTSTWHVRALMRLNDSVSTVAWVSSNALAIGGPAGLYMFDFLTSTAPHLP